VPCPHRPPDVQVLGQEGRGDHPHPVVHPALGQELPHAGVHDRVARLPGLPRGDGVGVRLVVREPAKARLQVLPQAVRVVEQHVRVELPPGQFGHEALGVRPSVRLEVGQQRAWVQDAELEVRGEPGGGVEVGAVATGRVPRQTVREEGAPPVQRRPLPCRRQVRDAGGVQRSLEAGPRLARMSGGSEDEAGGLLGRGPPAVLAPRPGERGEDLERLALPGADPSGRDHVRTARLDPGDADLGERVPDACVPGGAGGLCLGGDMDRPRPARPGESRQHLGRLSLEQREVSVIGLPQREQGRRQPRSAGGPRSVEEGGVEDEADRDLAPGGALVGCCQGGEISPTQVAPEPDDRAHAASLGIGQTLHK